MEAQNLLDIKPNGDAVQLTVRFIRKWSPSIYRPHFAYLLIDKHGNAIQANIHHLDKVYFETKIVLMSCYEIDDYICEERSSYMSVTNHPASIRLTKNMLLNEVPVPPHFPVHYFNLCGYEELCQRIDHKDILTDYAGRLDHINPKTTVTGRKLLRLKMTDISNQSIDVTVWEEIIPRFDYAEMEAAENPVIAVITSTTVTSFLEKPQLASTQATYIYFNPETDASTSLRCRFQDAAPIFPTSSERHISIQQQSQITTTISHIHEHRAEQRHQDKTFVCEATITNIPERRLWYYQQCPTCRRKVYLMKGKLSCGEHDNIKEPNLIYTVNATITDATGSAAITLFNNAVNTLLGTQCKNLVLEEGYDDPNTLPTPILALKGREALFHIHYTAGSYNLKVNRATLRTTPSTQTSTPPPETSSAEETKKEPAVTLHTSGAKRSLFEPTDVDDSKRSKFRQ